jgi:glucokinase
MMETYNIGIDIGGTNIRGAVVKGSEHEKIHSERINASAGAVEVVQQLFAFIDGLITDKVASIGIGVPGLVNEEKGLIFDVVNIPSWTELPLRHLVEERYALPVFINNDANCFALGEYYFGKGAPIAAKNNAQHTFIGLTLGTGLGSGIIINGKLYSGRNCGAGEFGMIEYLDHYFEYYASGQFFKNVYHINGEEVFEKAVNGDKHALKMMEEMGGHLGNAIKTILYSFEANLIVIGGSVRHSWPFFQDSMWRNLQSFAYKRILDEVTIDISDLNNSGILGAAALQYNHLK